MTDCPHASVRQVEISYRAAVHRGTRWATRWAWVCQACHTERSSPEWERWADEAKRAAGNGEDLPPAPTDNEPTDNGPKRRAQ